MNDLNNIYEEFGISKRVAELSNKVLKSLEERFFEIDKNAEYNQMKVLNAMQKHKVSDIHFAATTGYGYNDLGRDVLEDVYATAFRGESALVRPQLVSGTHALHVALSGNLRPGDELLSPVGKPYDTLEEIIGIRESLGSLKEFGIRYRQVDLLPDGGFDWDGIRNAINEKTRLVEIQRSKGYSDRRSFSPEEIGEIIRFVKSIKPDLICMVDNCYGEFVCTDEPSDFGADMVVGSLIKNPGGGLAPIGGYIAGTKACIERCAVRLYAPGLGKEQGPSLNLNKDLIEGFFLAPTVTASAEKSAILAASLFEKLGFSCHPTADTKRMDIIQAITLGSKEALLAFCEGIQAAAPVDAFVRPEADDMPGYEDQVVMAAGAFVQGSSIELSADAPIRPPYTVYFQGGLTFPHGKYGVIKALDSMYRKGFIKIEE